ncbi:DUF4097 family beta strand repeat-containing protein [Streptomyces boncukensis]|uniref:DUF4097 domain-containing protein n=1 Tax=Streptomyces boncukensis TaxID=2711219 RepID=A0A6G4X099_9ACTN|nr:DUF4097 family beta strand repeat-containing protein [Streptomyces boncukensis]NGO70091.1 DUF4097 domain-containing protein [Streptomyces boncukensis]
MSYAGEAAVPVDRSWQISEPQKADFPDPVTELHVRVVNGTVNVVGTDEDVTHLEVDRVEGPPLTVTHEDGKLVVAYEDLPWKGFLKWLDLKGWRRQAEISLSVPAHARLSLGVVGASAVVSGMRGRTAVKGVSGDSTLVGLTGPVYAETVSGNVETQRVSGTLRFHSVSGDLTSIDGSTSVHADTVSGALVLDVCPELPRNTDIKLTSISGDVAIRLPEDADTAVTAHTTSGGLSSAFDELRPSGLWGARQVTGTLGAGRGQLRADTVSGALALLKRPPQEDAGPDAGPDADHGAPHGPADPAGPSGADAPAGHSLRKEL